jgi:tetratricopeptide (TPR) repeat protein
VAASEALQPTPPAAEPVQWRRFRVLAAVLVVLLLAAVPVYGPRAYTAYRRHRLKRLPLNELATLARENPGDVEVRYQLGQAYARQGRYADATPELIAAVKIEPTRADILNDLGVAYLLQERYYEALLAFDGALKARPDYARALANLGRLHLATKMPFTAERELERASRLDPNDLDTLNDLGSAYMQTLNLQAARRVFEEATRRDPKRVSSWVELGRACQGLTLYPEARRSIDRALARNPDDAAAQLALGQLLLETGTTDAELRAAREALMRATQADPGSADAWYERGRASRHLHMEREAVEELRTALRLAPGHEGAMYQLSQALIATGDRKAGEELGRRFQEMVAGEREIDRMEERVHDRPDDTAAHLRLARLYLASGRYGMAILQCRQTLDLRPGDPEAQQLWRVAARQAGAKGGAPPAGATTP